MTELNFYIYNITAGIFIGLSLALIGPNLISRRQAPFIFSFSQISIITLLLSVILQFEGSRILIALLSSILCYVLQKTASKIPPEKENLIYTSAFIGLYAINQLLISRFPQLHAYSSLHHTGDIVTLLDNEAIGLTCFALLYSLLLILMRKKILKFEFQESISIRISERTIGYYVADFFVLMSYYFLLSISNLYFGFLYTVGTLFILTLFSSFSVNSLKSYYILILSVLMLVIPGVFYVSIRTNALAVPVVLLAHLTIFLILKTLTKLLSGSKATKEI